MRTLIFDRKTRGRLRLTTARRFSAYMSSRALRASQHALELFAQNHDFTLDTSLKLITSTVYATTLLNYQLNYQLYATT